MVSVVQVVLTEEHRCGIGTEHGLGSELSDEANDLFTKSRIVVDLAVGMPESVVSRQLQHLRRGSHLECPCPGKIFRPHLWICRALVPVRADENMHLASPVHPPRKRAPAGHVGIVGVRIDRERTARNRTEQLRQRSTFPLRLRGLGEQSHLPLEVTEVLETLVHRCKSQIRNLVRLPQMFEYRYADLLARDLVTRPRAALLPLVGRVSRAALRTQGGSCWRTSRPLPPSNGRTAHAGPNASRPRAGPPRPARRS